MNRKAVELADGWSFSGNDTVFINGSSTLWKPDKLPQHYLDALAAQLVRQVDALSPGIVITSDFSGCCLIVSDDDDWFAGDSKVGPKTNDRTMNTIKAIVDSGVLE
jgi:hypothetical protein